MRIHINQVAESGTVFQGEEPGAILELEEDRFAHADGPVVYELEARIVSGELVVTGRLQAPVKLLCGRCGGFFSTTLGVSSFLRAYSLSESPESVDLTEDIREDVLLEVPGFPRCAWTDAQGVCPYSGLSLDALRQVEQPARDNRWAALDGFEPE